MITVMLLAGGATVVLDRASRQLVADVRLAMKRADLSLDYVSRVTGIPPSRLSDQLNGKTPFTGFWRFWVGEMRDTDFRIEFLELQAGHVDRLLVRVDLGALIQRLDELVTSTRMAKANLTAPEQKEQAS